MAEADEHVPEAAQEGVAGGVLDVVGAVGGWLRMLLTRATTPLALREGLSPVRQLGSSGKSRQKARQRKLLAMPRSAHRRRQPSHWAREAVALG